MHTTIGYISNILVDQHTLQCPLVGPTFCCYSGTVLRVDLDRRGVGAEFVPGRRFPSNWSAPKLHLGWVSACACVWNLSLFNGNTVLAESLTRHSRGSPLRILSPSRSLPLWRGQPLPGIHDISQTTTRKNCTSLFRSLLFVMYKDTIGRTTWKRWRVKGWKKKLHTSSFSIRCSFMHCIFCRCFSRNSYI